MRPRTARNTDLRGTNVAVAEWQRYGTSFATSGLDENCYSHPQPLIRRRGRPAHRQRYTLEASAMSIAHAVTAALSILTPLVLLAQPVPAAEGPVPGPPDKGAFRQLRDAPQVMYRDGVPHLDRNGRVRVGYDAQRSFLPLGLYHGLNYLDSLDPDSGRLPAPFGEFRKAGFTYVHTNKALSQAYLDRLHRFGLRMVKSEARPEDAQRFAGHPAMLGWDVFDEPDSDGSFAAYPGRFEAFARFRDGIRAHDPVRPIFVNTVAWIHAGHQNRAWWIKWHQAGDLSCHDNYPIVHAKAPTETLTDPQWGQSIPETVALAVQSTGERKPVWAILQAYGQLAGGRWRFPSPTEVRCMAYAAVVHGATGLCWFSLDVDDVRRNATGWGISPAPLPTYNADAAGHVADDACLADIRRLWSAVARTNHEIAALREYLFAPTSGERYRVYVRGESASETPVHTLLKQAGGRWLLITVNLDNAPLELRLVFPMRMGVTGARQLFGEREHLTFQRGRLEFRAEPFGVGVYELSASEAGAQR